MSMVGIGVLISGCMTMCLGIVHVKITMLSSIMCGESSCVRGWLVCCSDVVSVSRAWATRIMKVVPV